VRSRQPCFHWREPFSKPRTGLILAVGLLRAFAAHAQEALRSALSADAAINAQTNAVVTPQPDSPRAGPVLLNVGPYLGVTFDDNINTSQDHPRSDTSIHAGLNLGFLWPATDNSKIQFDSQFGYVTYLAHTRSDSVEIAPNSALTWALSFDQGTLTFYDQFNYSEEVVTVPSVAGLNSLPRLDNTIGARAQWFPGQWQLEAGLSHDDFRSTSSSFDYLDRGSEYLSLRGAWRFAESTQAGLELSAGQTDYRLSIQSDNTSYSIGPYANWNITEFLTANISGGPTIYRFDAAGGQPASTLVSYYFDFELRHQLTQFFSYQLAARQEVDLGFNRGNNYTKLLSFSDTMTWAATQYATLGLSITYQHGTQPFFFILKENFDRFGAAVNVSYRLTDRLGSGVSFSHWERTSNVPGNGYSDDSVSFQLNYNF
jgi:hypothetical protein